MRYNHQWLLTILSVAWLLIQIAAAQPPYEDGPINVASLAGRWNLALATGETGYVQYNAASGVFTLKFNSGTSGNALIQVYGAPANAVATHGTPNTACPSISINPAAQLFGSPGGGNTGNVPFLITVSGPSTIPDTTNPQARTTIWTFRLGPDVANSRNVFANDPATNQAIVSFYMKFGLTDPTSTNANQLVNYKEVGLDLTIDLNANIAVDFVARTVDPIQLGPQRVRYDNYARVCQEAGVTAGQTTFRQGDVVPLCVCTDRVPAVRVRQITDLQFQAVGGLVQQAVVDGVAQSGSVEIGPCFRRARPDQPQTQHSCCQVNTILSSFFYPDSNGAGDVTVRAVGSALMAVDGGRRELDDFDMMAAQPQSIYYEHNNRQHQKQHEQLRHLQQPSAVTDEETEFETSITIAWDDDSPNVVGANTFEGGWQPPSDAGVIFSQRSWMLIVMATSAIVMGMVGTV